MHDELNKLYKCILVNGGMVYAFNRFSAPGRNNSVLVRTIRVGTSEAYILEPR